MESKKQTKDEIMEFARRLELLKMNNINSIFYEMLPLCGFGPTIAFSRFLSLHRKICFGSYALINAYRKNHKSLWGEDLEDSLWERSMYFENAIEAYNKVIDYVYVILYFNFELYKIIDNEEIKTKDDIKRISKKISGDKLGEISKWISTNRSTLDFSSKFIKYKKFDVSDMRNLANDIKHRGCIALEGTELPRNTKVTKEIDGCVIDITEQVSPIIINLDSEIEKLVKIHSSTLDLQRELYNVCDFPKQVNDFYRKFGLMK